MAKAPTPKEKSKKERDNTKKSVGVYSLYYSNLFLFTTQNFTTWGH